MNLNEILLENPIIAAVTADSNLQQVIDSDALVVFILHGSILNIKDMCDRLKEAHKLVFVHIDMVEGLKADSAALEFIKKHAEPYGIITTKPTNIRHAKQLGFCTVQRIFAIDSLSLKSGIKNIKDVRPDAVEVMPGVASKIISKIQKEVQVPVIAGGLIENKKDVMDALGSGAVAISTSDSDLWNM
ncbi:glycerol-3-phosphate responsive antiterminator [Clostridium sp. SYSU_GA19001]|uniref:glycerol-3-phosphate responsive antiterminator n=1 Tax=Clostridium caldaquaticum TaxID=2940653 RepID=UPI0020771E71|nr:glycerol-3-phosphate responsive antiterminator [Clostridium caldaquaticum]